MIVNGSTTLQVGAIHTFSMMRRVAPPHKVTHLLYERFTRLQIITVVRIGDDDPEAFFNPP